MDLLLGDLYNNADPVEHTVVTAIRFLRKPQLTVIFFLGTIDTINTFVQATSFEMGPHQHTCVFPSSFHIYGR